SLSAPADANVLVISCADQVLAVRQCARGYVPDKAATMTWASAQ
ncbi:MAG: hypothetical protein QOI02_276, partial [Actinomycetota bacterium]|nr:hypothetical protein [Actinomycetota bacterium]